MPKEYEKLLQYSLRLLARKRYTKGKMLEKLEQFFEKKKMEEREELKEVMDRLMELRYIDDDSFARDFVKDRVRFQPRGKFMVSQELRKKGIEKEIIKKAVEEEFGNEEEVALALLQRQKRKIEKWPEAKVKEKLFQYLAGKGFSVDTIYKTINSYYNQDR